MYGDFEKWHHDTGLLYDQVVANFYREINDGDKAWLAGLRIGLHGDNRPWPKSRL